MSLEKDFDIQRIMASADEAADMDFFPIAPGDEQGEQIEIPDNLPILPLRNMVIFPNIMLPISVGREKSLNLIRKAFRGNKLVGAVAQRDVNVDEPSPADLYQNGTVIQIIRIFEMPDDSTTIIVQGKKQFRINEFTAEEPYFTANIDLVENILPQPEQMAEFEAIVGSIRDLATKIIRLSPNMPNEAAFALRNIKNAYYLINFVCVNSSISTDTKQTLIEEVRFSSVA